MKKITKPLMFGAAAVSMTAIASSTVLAEEIQPVEVSENVNSSTAELTNAQDNYNAATEEYNSALENQQLYNEVQNQIVENENLIVENEALEKELVSEKENVQTEIQNVDAEIEAGKTNLQEAQTNYETMLNETDGITEESLLEANTELENSQMQEADYKQTFDAVKKEWDNTQTEIRHTENAVESTDKTINLLSDENEKLEKENTSLHQSIIDKTEELNKLETSDEITPEYQAMLDAVQKNQSELKALKDQKSQSEKEVLDKQKQDSDLISQIKTKDEEIADLNEKYNQTKDALDQASLTEETEKKKLDEISRLSDSIQNQMKDADNNLKDANKELKETKALLEHTLKELETAKKEAENAKTFADNAQVQINKGTKGFFESIGADEAVKMLAYPDLQQYVHLGQEGDATSLEQMRLAIDYINECNRLRAGEGKEPLEISSYLMAMGQITADAVRDKAINENSIGHLRIFRIDENIAYYTDPYLLWYTEEKQAYDQGSRKMNEVGHYLNIVDPNHTITGYGVSRNYFHVQEFDSLEYFTAYNAVGDETYTCEEYSQMFDAYYSKLQDADKAYRDALMKQNLAEEAVEKAQTLYAAALDSVKEKEALLATLKEQENTAKTEFDKQSKNVQNAVNNKKSLASSYQYQQQQLADVTYEKLGLEQSLETIQQQIKQFSNSILNLDEKIAAVQQRYDDSIKELESADPNNVKEAAIVNAKKELEGLKSKWNENCQTIENNTQKISDLKKNRNQYIQKKESLGTLLTNLEDQVNAAVSNILNAEKNTEAAQKKVNQIKEALKRQTDVKDSLQNAKENLEELLKLKNQYETQLSDIDTQIETLIAENDTLIARNESLRKQAEQYFELCKDIDQKEKNMISAKAALDETIALYHQIPQNNEITVSEMWEVVSSKSTSDSVQTGVAVDGTLWSCLFSASGFIILSLKKREEV